MKPWSINAVNLPEHDDNPVHTIAGGLAAGFGGAVVAGATIFFLVSNLGNWFAFMQPLTLEGLILCYVNGLPFFGQAILAGNG